MDRVTFRGTFVKKVSVENMADMHPQHNMNTTTNICSVIAPYMYNLEVL